MGWRLSSLLPIGEAWGTGLLQRIRVRKAMKGVGHCSHHLFIWLHRGQAAKARVYARHSLVFRYPDGPLVRLQ